MTRWEGLDSYMTVNYEIDGVKNWVWRYADEQGFSGPAHDWNMIRDTILKHTPRRNLIVQAGGCCGLYPRLWSKYFKVVHTFEPVYNNFWCLCQNCPSGDIHKHEAALGDVEGFVRMIGGNYQDIDTHMIHKNAGQYWVSGMYDSGICQIPLDKLQLPYVDAIQLDVEKYETKVLKGAINTIKKFKPTICIETYDKEGEKLLRSLGYEVVDRASRDYVLVSINR